MVCRFLEATVGGATVTVDVGGAWQVAAMEAPHPIRAAVVDYYAGGSHVAVALAEEWTRKQARDLGETVDVWVARAGDADDEPIRGLVRRLRAHVRAPRSRGLQPPRGRVTIAVCPQMEDIAAMEQYAPAERALCVLSLSEVESRAWRRRVGARVLDSRPEYLPGGEWHLRPTVVVALRHVVQVVPDYNGLSGQDGKRAGSALKALHQAKFALPHREILGWALEAGWRPSAAAALADLAKRAHSGVNIHVGPRPLYGSTDVHRWRVEAGELDTASSSHEEPRNRQW